VADLGGLGRRLPAVHHAVTQALEERVPVRDGIRAGRMTFVMAGPGQRAYGCGTGAA